MTSMAVIKYSVFTHTKNKIGQIYLQILIFTLIYFQVKNIEIFKLLQNEKLPNVWHGIPHYSAIYRGIDVTFGGHHQKYNPYKCTKLQNNQGIIHGDTLNTINARYST